MAVTFGRRTATIATVAALALAGAGAGATAAQAKDHSTKQGKVWVCKYVGKPGVNERLKAGKNPIHVSAKSIKVDGPVKVGDWFPDAHGRSVVVSLGEEDPGIEKCPTMLPTPTPKPTPDKPTSTPTSTPTPDKPGTPTMTPTMPGTPDKPKPTMTPTMPGHPDKPGMPVLPKTGV